LIHILEPSIIVRNIEVTDTCTSGDACATDSSTFERLQRVVNSCERVYHRTLKELEVARAHSLRTPQADPEPSPAPPTPRKTTPKPPDRTQAAPSAKPDSSANPAETQPSTVDWDPKAAGSRKKTTQFSGNRNPPQSSDTTRLPLGYVGQASWPVRRSGAKIRACPKRKKPHAN
jgi:hypothetical protein